MSYSVIKYPTQEVPETGLIKTFNRENICIGQANFLGGRFTVGFSYSDNLEVDPKFGEYQKIIARFKVKI